MKLKTLMIINSIVTFIIFTAIAFGCIKGCQYIQKKGLKQIGTELMEGTEVIGE